MNSISRPFVTQDDPDRDIRCQDALDWAFRELLDRAVEAGWSERESVAAFLALAESHMLATVANDDSNLLRGLLERMTGRSA